MNVQKAWIWGASDVTVQKFSGTTSPLHFHIGRHVCEIAPNLWISRHVRENTNFQVFSLMWLLMNFLHGCFFKEVSPHLKKRLIIFTVYRWHNLRKGTREVEVSPKASLILLELWVWDLRVFYIRLYLAARSSLSRIDSVLVVHIPTIPLGKVMFHLCRDS